MPSIGRIIIEAGSFEAAKTTATATRAAAPRIRYSALVCLDVTGDCL